jgi:hypothetical protein
MEAMASVGGRGACVGICLAAAALFSSVGVVIVDKDFTRRADERIALGTVVGNVERRIGDESRFHPVIRFRDDAHGTHALPAASSYERGDAPVFDVGDKVAILYDPAYPQRFRIETIFERWGPPALCALAALVGLAVAARIRRGRRAAAPAPAPASASAER